MPGTEQISFRCGEETLHGLAVSAEKNPPNFLFLHGAGRSDHTRTTYLMERLAEQGTSSFAFDFSGHGQSSGTLAEASLAKRTAEAMTAIDQFLAPAETLTVCGSSMSGHIALKLLEAQPNIQNLILFCPAIYDAAAFEVPFGSGFTDIIRQPDSWRQSEVLSLLEQFTGNLLVFIGAEDMVIPKGVIDLLDAHSPNVQKKEIITVPVCDHLIHSWISARPELVDEVTEKILDFINK